MNDYSFHNLISFLLSQANNSWWFQPWKHEVFSYTLPRCLYKFDYSRACKLALMKAGQDFQKTVSTRVFFSVDLRLWFISRKKNDITKDSLCQQSVGALNFHFFRKHKTNDYSFHNLISFFLSQANNSWWFQPWKHEAFSYTLPRC